MDEAVLALRVVVSLAAVLGLIWFATRKLQGTAMVRRQKRGALTVLDRRALGKGASVALVEVAGRALLLGVGDDGVRLLTEVDLPPEDEDTPPDTDEDNSSDSSAADGEDDSDAKGSSRISREVREPIDPEALKQMIGS